MKRDTELQRQVYLLEKNTGTLCRILEMYAARGIEVDAVLLGHAAPRTMMLTVTAEAEPELLRVLVNKCATLVGVIEAAEMMPRGSANIRTAVSRQAS